MVDGHGGTRSIGQGHEIRRLDVLHRLLDDTGGACHGAGAAWLRHRLGARALAHSAVSQDALRTRRRSAETLLRCDGSVRHSQYGGGRDEDAEDWYRCVPDRAARSDPDREAGGLDRSSVRRTLRVRRRRRLEPGRDGKPRHRLQIASQAGARTHRGDESDLDTGRRRVPWRVRRFRSDADLAEACAEAAPSHSGRWRIPV